MNTKPTKTQILKYISLALASVFFLILATYLYFNTAPLRTIANQNLKSDQLTAGQKQKWLVTQQFSIQQTNESMIIDIPHLVDLCSENTNLVFKFTAYEVAVAGENPNLKLNISCGLALSEQQTHFEILFSDLISLHEFKEKKIPHGELKSFLIYSDEPFPLRWNLSEILIEGLGGFTINQFEIQKVFGHNFEFELLK